MPLAMLSTSSTMLPMQETENQWLLLDTVALFVFLKKLLSFAVPAAPQPYIVRGNNSFSLLFVGILMT